MVAASITSPAFACGQRSEVTGVITQAELASILPTSFDVAEEIADEFDLIGIVVRNLHAYECIFDQYHQLEAIVTIHPEFTEVRFIRKLFRLNTYILGDESANFVGIKRLLWCGSLSYAQTTEGHRDASLISSSTSISNHNPRRT
jgi:hypothetical protein